MPATVINICRFTHGIRGISGNAMSRPQPSIDQSAWKNGESKYVIVP